MVLAAVLNVVATCFNVSKMCFEVRSIYSQQLLLEIGQVVEKGHLYNDITAVENVKSEKR